MKTFQKIEGLSQDHRFFLFIEWVLVWLQFLEFFVLVSLESVSHHDQLILELFAGPYVYLTTLEVFDFDLHVCLLLGQLVVVDCRLRSVDALFVEFAYNYARKLDVFVHELGDGICLLDIFGDVLDLVSHLLNLLVIFQFTLELLLLFLDGSLIAILLLLHLFHGHVSFNLEFRHFVLFPQGLLLLLLLDLFNFFLLLLFLFGFSALGLHTNGPVQQLLLLLELLFEPLLRLHFRLLQLFLLLFLLLFELLLFRSEFLLHLSILQFDLLLMLFHLLLVLLSFLLLDHLKVKLPFLLFHFVDLVEGLAPVNCVMIVSDFFICILLADHLAQIGSDALFKKS